MYIVRKDSGGVAFNYLIGDSVAQLWFDTPRGAKLTQEEAAALGLTCDRTVPVPWREMGVLREHIILPGSRMIECGCHQGLTTLMASAWVGQQGMVHAFDAVPFNTLVARRNLELNAVTNAVVCCIAIGGERGLVNLYNQSNSITKRENWVGPSAAVMVRLDDVVTFDIDVLKLDIEGAELDVLEASNDLIATIPRLAIEVHTDLLPPDGLARIIAALPGRRLHVLWEDGRFEPYADQTINARVHLFAF